MPAEFFFRGDKTELLDFPWDHELSSWQNHCDHLVELPRGASRHPVIFINAAGPIYALKELPHDLARREYKLLTRMEDKGLPVVSVDGYALISEPERTRSILITRYLDNSLPYSSLFTTPTLERYRTHLLDALAGLLVQIHLSGVYWGDCSLYNTLFRRNAGMLQAYLVDAETAEIHPRLSDGLRLQDLNIMQENVLGGIVDLVAGGFLHETIHPDQICDSIQQKYTELWNEINREIVIGSEDRYRIRERIEALNDLGFSVASVDLKTTTGGDALRLKVQVTDRNFHCHQLQFLTGIRAEEMQARQMMNEIQELKATTSSKENHSIPLSVAAYDWFNHLYRPVIDQLVLPVGDDRTEPEIYCQFLEHKWFLSEKAQQDVGHEFTLQHFSGNIPG